MLLAFQGSGWRKSPTAGSRLHDGRNMGLGPLGEKRRAVARLLTAGTAVQDFLTPASAKSHRRARHEQDRAFQSRAKGLGSIGLGEGGEQAIRPATPTLPNSNSVQTRPDLPLAARWSSGSRPGSRVVGAIRHHQID